MSTFVRRMVAADMPDVLALARAFHAESAVHRDYNFDDEKMVGLISGAIASDDWLILLAFSGDDLIGFTMVYTLPMFFGLDLETNDLAFYVRPTSRGGRAAPTMMKQLLEWAWLRGSRKVTIGLYTGINHDAAARLLERRFEFKRAGLLMTLTFTDDR